MDSCRSPVVAKNSSWGEAGQRKRDPKKLRSGALEKYAALPRGKKGEKRKKRKADVDPPTPTNPPHTPHTPAPHPAATSKGKKNQTNLLKKVFLCEPVRRGNNTDSVKKYGRNKKEDRNGGNCPLDLHKGGPDFVSEQKSTEKRKIPPHWGTRHAPAIRYTSPRRMRKKFTR